jgi:hypothetical protein
MSFLRGQDAWRRHPIFSWGVLQALPGIREGAAAFALYCTYEAVAHRMTHKAPAAAAPHGDHAEVVHQGGLAGGPAHAAKAHH